RLETESLRSKQQHRAGDGRLRYGRFVKVPNRLHLGARQHALESFVAAFDAGDELADIVVGLDFVRFDGFAFVVTPADEPHLGQEVFRWIGDKIEDCILLPNLRCCHYYAFRLFASTTNRHQEARIARIFTDEFLPGGAKPGGGSNEPNRCFTVESDARPHPALSPSERESAPAVSLRFAP